MSKIDTLIAELCPNGVEHRTLVEVCKSGRKGSLKREELITDGAYPVVNGGMGYYGRYDCFNNEGNCIVFSSRGAAGYVSYQHDPFYAAALCYPFFSKDENVLNTRFLYFALKTQEKENIERLVSRGGVPALNKSDVLKIEIPVPPMEVQREVIRILDAFTALTDTLIEELDCRRQQYGYYRDRLLSQENLEALEGKPVEMKRLGDISINGPMYGSNTKAVAYDDTAGYRYIRITDIDDAGNLGDDLKSPEAFDERYLLKNGDLLFARSGATAGKTMLYCDTMGPAVFAGYLIRFEIDGNQVLPRYVFHSARTQRYWDWANATKGGGAQPNISAKAYGNFEIPVPSLATQQKVVDILDRFDTLTTSLTDGIPAEIAARKAQYAYYRDRLLDFPRRAIETE